MGSDKMVRALRTVALLLRSERIGVGRPMSLLALLVICVSLFNFNRDGTIPYF